MPKSQSHKMPFRLRCAWSLGLMMWLCVVSVNAQSGSRWFLTLGPSVTVGNRFENGKTSIYAPDITGGHHIGSMFSPLWGFPNPQYSPLQNLGRKLHLGVQYEYFFSPKLALVTGAELGARGYIINTDFSNDLLISYRTLGIPLYGSFTIFNGNFWAFRQNAGLKFLYASSIPGKVAGNYEINQKRSISPQLYAGIELIHQSFNAPFSFEVGYAHGFTNLIKHNYLALDYVTPVAVYSSGSAWQFTVKYLFQEKQHLRRSSLSVQLDQYSQLAYRNVKNPLEIIVTTDSVRVCVVDDQTVDGDSIAVEFNGRLIHLNIGIDKEPYCFDLKLNSTGDNSMIVHALNEGRIPPNTCVIYVYQNESKQEVYLKSDMKNSGAIVFRKF